MNNSTLNDSFTDTMNREGQIIYINNVQHTVFFRRSDKTDSTSYDTLYAFYSDNIKQGAEFTLNGNRWLIMKRIRDENTVYQRYNCVKCNQIVKIIYSKGYIVEYNIYCDEIQRSLDYNSSSITLSSKLNLIMSLNDDSKKIDVNQRFYCGSFHSAWQVDEKQYQDGLLYLYCSRSAVLSDDDTVNGIADRWKYDTKPASYAVYITEDNATINVDKTFTPTISVTKDGTVITTPVLTWTNSDSTIATVDASTNVISGKSAGTTNLTAYYKPNIDDTCTSDSISITVNKPVIVGNIVVTPSYNESSDYRLTKASTITFSCSISGVDFPTWNIIQKGMNTKDKCVIDNTSGTFKVTNNTGSCYSFTVTIAESSSGKSTTYTIFMGSLF